MLKLRRLAPAFLCFVSSGPEHECSFTATFRTSFSPSMIRSPRSCTDFHLMHLSKSPQVGIVPSEFLCMLTRGSAGLADHVLVNSEFTKEVFHKTFKLIGAHVDPDVLYPCVDIKPAEAAR